MFLFIYLFSHVTCSALPFVCRRSVIFSKPQSQRLLLDSPQLPAGCSEAVRVAVAGVVRAPCHPQRPQCSFPFHLECEIAAGAALTSALRGQLLKSDVRLSG